MSDNLIEESSNLTVEAGFVVWKDLTVWEVKNSLEGSR